MYIHHECLHWKVCNMPCPKDISDCPDSLTKIENEAQWLLTSSGDYRCSHCENRNKTKTTYCPKCGFIMK